MDGLFGSIDQPKIHAPAAIAAGRNVRDLLV
jgi:hypothetical protein